jgi:hypothetical protein
MSSKPTLVVVPSELAGALGWTETGLALGTEGDDSFFDALVGSIEIGGASSLGCEETDGGAVFVVNSGA